MGWYFRKSYRLGPVRFNLSKSGVGASFGVKGARIGVDPRGRQYIRLGRGGVYYQKYLNASSAHSPAQAGPSFPPAPTVSTELAEVVQTASASSLRDSNAAELLHEINARYHKTRIAPVVIVGSAMAMLTGIFAHFPLWVAIVIVLLGIVLHVIATRVDYKRKILHLDYDLDQEATVAYLAMLENLDEFRSSGALWRISSGEMNSNPKYHAGAGYSVKRYRISSTFQQPPFIFAQYAIFQINTGLQKLFFLPDRILIYQGDRVGALGYSDLQCAVTSTNFVEEQQVPFDTRVVGTTWRYTNKSGGPDRRFANNPQIPVVEYAQIGLRSASGLNYLLESSNMTKAQIFVQAVQRYADYLNSAKPLPPTKTPLLADPSSAG